MKFTTNILGDLGRAIGLASPGLQETELVIPPDVDLVIEPTSIVDLCSNGTFANQDVSSSIGFVLNGSVANGVTQIVTGPKIGKGLWRLVLDIDYGANYQNYGAANLVYFANASGSKTLVVASTFPQGAFAVHSDKSFLVSFSEPMGAFIALAGNGVGNSHGITCAYVMTRVL